MAVTGTSYSDWMRQNPEIVNQASDRMGGTTAQLAPVQSQAQPVAAQAQPAPLPQAKMQLPPAAQTNGQNSIATQLADVKETPRNGAQLSEGSAMGEVTPPVDTGQHGMEGIFGIAKTIASIYTGGALGAATSAAGAGAQNRQVDNKGQPQGGNQGGQMMGMLSGFMGSK